MITLHLFLCSLAVLWIYFLWSRRRIYKLMLELPGPIGYPIIGSTYEHVIQKKRKISVRTKYFNKYGNTILTWIGPVPIVITRDPNFLKDVFATCHNKSVHMVKAITNCMGNGILSTQDPAWHEHRKNISPSFKLDLLLTFLPIFETEANRLVSLLETYVDKGEKSVIRDMLRWSVRIAAQTTLGPDVKEEELFKNDTLVEKLNALISLTTLNLINPLAQKKIIVNLFGHEKQKTAHVAEVFKMVDNVVEKRLNSKEESSGVESNILVNIAIDLYRKGVIKYNDIRSECGMMIAAGFDTSGLTAYHTLYTLAAHPQFQAKVFDELTEVFPNSADFQITHTDVQKLVYLDRVIKETLRLIPAIPITAREAATDLRLPNGVVIPKGVLIGTDIFHTHRNPEFWGPEADIFNPDNFLPENLQKRHSHAFVGFARGKRNCIGLKYAMLSIKFVLAKILRNYRVKTSFPFKDLVFVDNMTMKLVEYPRLEFLRRT
ncbi:probable cytochrome P450 313a1 [Drosophila ficusphila]|uniref:probable cytochrome P450 313a1 n=1 Tax=Drosophila ficusphila TaxID=30025 RepID=UPI001C890783|nr:probable cytochrome P450 313a1 [Drosophila ficusphila]